MNIRSALPIIGILFLAACRGDSPAAPVGSAALLTLVPDPVLNDEQHAAFTAIRDRAMTAEVHVGRIVDAPERILEEGWPLRISLAPGRKVTALREDVNRWAE